MDAEVRQDTVWINLKILAQLPPYCRINTQNELFSIERETWAFFTRWLRGDHRGLTIKRVDDLISKGRALLFEYKLQRKKKEYKNMITHLSNSSKGLLQLKKTYENDYTALASIDRILDKIEEVLPSHDDNDKDKETAAE